MELFNAIEINDAAEAQRLIAEGADVNATDDAGWTPLHRCAIRNSIRICMLLLEAGARVNEVIPLNHDTPLHIAATNSNVEIIELLVESGADLNVKDGDGYAPLHICARYGSVLCAKTLLDNGADVNATNFHGETPLHTYFTYRDATEEVDQECICIDFVRLFLKHEADITLLDNDGDSVSDFMDRNHMLESSSHYIEELNHMREHRRIVAMKVLHEQHMNEPLFPAADIGSIILPYLEPKIAELNISED